MTFEALLDKCLDNDVLALYQLYEYQLTLEDINHLFNHLESISEQDEKYYQARTLLSWYQLRSLPDYFNTTQTITFYEQAIAHKNSLAHVLLALIHIEGTGGMPINYPEAITLLDSAILLNDTMALLYRARMHAKGQGGPINYAAAIEMYFKGVLKDDSMAMNNLAKIHLERKNYQDAIMLLDKAIELNNSAAMYTRAGMHLDGLGGFTNYQEAMRLYEKATGLNFVKAYNNLGYMYLKGWGEPVNYLKARQLFEQAIEKGSDGALINLGRMLINGLGCNVDIDAGIKLYQRAIGLGNIEAMYLMANVYESGQNGSANAQKAIDLYFEAYYRSKHKASLEALERLAKSNFIYAKTKFILIYLINKQPNKASLFFLENPTSFMPILYKDLIQLFDQPAKKIDLIELLLKFLKRYSEFSNLTQLQYLQFKIYLYQGKEQQALRVYKDHLEFKQNLTAEEFYLIGNVLLSGMEDLIDTNKIKCMEQACYAYNQAYEISNDKVYFDLLIKILRTKKALKEHLFPGDIMRAADKEDCVLYNQFLNELTQSNDHKKIMALNSLIIAKQHHLQKKNQLPFFPNNSLSIAKKLKDKLEHGTSLENSLNDIQLLRQIKKNSALYKVLMPLLTEPNPLNQIIDADDCKRLLQEQNCETSVLKMLSEKEVISPEGLNLLANNKKIIEFVRNMSTQQLEALKSRSPHNPLVQLISLIDENLNNSIIQESNLISLMNR